MSVLASSTPAWVPADTARAGSDSMSKSGRLRRIWTPAAWIGPAWRSDVLLEIDETGRWSSIRPDTAPPADALRLEGALLPGVVNAHSHAFQRGFAGLAERRDQGADDFWSWRERMYQLALRVSPKQLSVIAEQLYIEMLEGGYTQVCEFHYLHRAADGSSYPDPLAMSRALAEAANAAGIGLTLLPVLYERAGFGQTDLSERQRRFRSSVEDVLAMRDTVRSWRLPDVSAGVAIHSLRAASLESIRALAESTARDPGPIHIHIAEQQAEVRDCLATTGLRPISWLCQNVAVDKRWHLEHATHTDQADRSALIGSGAAVVLCPSTEANLGDGRFEVEQFTAALPPISLGSDSHVCRNWMQELRLLEYGHRLALQRRGIMAQPDQARPSTAEALFALIHQAGPSAAGIQESWGLVTGARADAIELDPAASGLLGIPISAQLDAAVFACDSAPVARVWQAGRLQVENGRHRHRDRSARDFARVVASLAG